METSANLEEVSTRVIFRVKALRMAGKVLRDGQGQASNRTDDEVLDLVITNALVIDWSGIYKVGCLCRSYNYYAHHLRPI